MQMYKETDLSLTLFKRDLFETSFIESFLNRCIHLFFEVPVKCLKVDLSYSAMSSSNEPSRRCSRRLRTAANWHHGNLHM